ncbi:hypothetical protein HYU96_01760 [Candidatus Daviesbacteria bacterium]|nr:hypothetical protein [Candidatus Daviesbacteria bacterium]
MKILVTHINPHLDDILAIWLFKKFHPEFKEAKIEFLSAAKKGVTYQGKPVDSDPEVIHFGIGRGKFDEHKGDLGQSAGSLVWQEIKNSSLAPKDGMELGALDELVAWNNLIDTGKAPNYEFAEFSVQSFLRPLDSKPETSQKAIDLGSEILDRILEVLKKKQRSLKDWNKRMEFQTRFGQTKAISSGTVDRAFCKMREGDLFIIFNPKYHSIQYFTPKDLDLEPIYQQAKKLDPEADWYFHHSKHIIICGSHSAPGSKPTKLSFEQLIELAKSV